MGFLEPQIQALFTRPEDLPLDVLELLGTWAEPVLDAINNYHGLGDGFIEDVYTTHRNYDFGVLSWFMMFYYWFQVVVTWGWFIIVLLCVLLASMICGSQGYWRFHNGPQSLIFQYWTGWWFGTFFIFPYIGNNNPNWLIFFRGVETTNQERFNFLASELEPQSQALWGTQLDSDDFCRPVGSNEKNLVSGMTPIYHN